MGNLATTYQTIADILSFNSSNIALEKKLSTTSFDWDVIVIEGSKHLVLPAIYCRLRAKQLLHVLPDELETYLEELTTINRNRNKAILRQVHTLTELLNREKIEHVFLKGAALLASGYYEDIAERMVGDIDILVDIDQLEQANQLLQQNDYKSFEETLGNAFFEHKHLPRLITTEHICAIELHRKLFMTYQLNALNTQSVLSRKQLINGVLIPSTEHLLLHTILNYQINDYGMRYKTISFRPAYDTLILLNYDKPSELQNFLDIKPVKHYFKYLTIFFSDLAQVPPTRKTLIKKLFLFRLRYPKFNRLRTKILNAYGFIKVLVNRFCMFLVNSNYRKAILADRKRVINHLKKRLFLMPKEK